QRSSRANESPSPRQRKRTLMSPRSARSFLPIWGRFGFWASAYRAACGACSIRLIDRDDPEVRIRPAVLADASRLAELHVRSWQAGYRGLLPQSLLDDLDPVARLARWEAILQDTNWPGQGTLVAEEGNELVGVARLCPERDTRLRAVGEVAAFHVA